MNETSSERMAREARVDLSVRAEWARRLTRRGDPRGVLLVASEIPSEHAWHTLMAHLSPCEDPGIATWLDLYLTHWPDDLRVLPAGWHDVLAQQRPLHHAWVCRVLRGDEGDIGDRDLIRLARTASMAQLRSIELGSQFVGDHGLMALARSPFFSALSFLDLSHNQICDAGVLALGRAATLHRLVWLNLGRNRIGAEGAQALAHAPSLAQLETLILAWNDVGPEGAAALARATGLPSLRALNLGGNRLRDEGACALAHASGLGSLERLELHHNQITDRGIEALAGATLGALTEIFFENNPVGDAGRAALTARSEQQPDFTWRL